jgi:hypothetical protein
MPSPLEAALDITLDMRPGHRRSSCLHGWATGCNLGLITRQTSMHEGMHRERIALPLVRRLDFVASNSFDQLGRQGASS